MSEKLNIVRNEIKSYIAASGWSLVDIVAKMNESRSKDEQTTPQNISNKLTRGTIKYSEVKEIANIIGYAITWENKNGG
ncbi:MAG: LLM class flavin-dependent oxidoreductase [Oscillospiraceae bacterium]|nr:LLM class flavin-dependent oxidoreductase [Oscillospiraceae bacterium]